MPVEIGLIVVVILMGIRVTALSAERVAFHGLGSGDAGALPTMGIAFGGATLVLWGMAAAMHQVLWFGDAIWAGLIYAFAFGLYTAALAKGPVSAVSVWSNGTILILWFLTPTGGAASIAAIVLFAVGVVVMMGKQRMSRAVLWMMLSDIFFAAGRLVDTAHTGFPFLAYAASLFTSITLWMLVPLVARGELHTIGQLVKARPVWSFSAASTNAMAYLTLFALLHFLPPPIVEGVSALAGFTATVAGLMFFKESNGVRKVIGSSLMTIGVLILIWDHVRMVHT